MPRLLLSVTSACCPLLLVLLSGCGPANVTDRLPTFETQLASQRAVFLTESWTGGGGDPLQLELGGRPVKVEGRDVLLRSEAAQQVRKGIGPQPPECRRGAVLVDARIRIEPASAGTSAEDGSKRSIHSVVIEELFHSEWYIDTMDE